MTATLKLAVGGLLLASLTASACAENTESGKVLYEMYCTQCHGLSGHGDGVNAPQLSIQPRNHTDRAEMSARTDEELFKAIKEGGQAVNKSVLMPNWDGNMSDEQIRDVVAYLRELCCEAGN